MPNVPDNPNKTDEKGLRQGKWTILYDKDWSIVSEIDKAEFYRLITYKDDKPIGKVFDHYKNGNVQMEATLLADRPAGIMDGEATWYREDGSKKMIRRFDRGKQTDEINYNLDGSIATEPWKSLDSQALQLYKAGKYKEAQTFWEKALIQAEKEFGKGHPDYAGNVSKLALVYVAQGQYSKAEPLYIEALNIFEKVLGKNTRDYATTLINLARLYDTQGQYVRAEPLFLEATEIYAKTIGKDSPDYATSLDNLAALYFHQGQYAKAEPLIVEAIKIYTEALGKDSREYAQSLNSLAGLYDTQGQYAKAEPLYLEAIEIYAKTLGKDHPNYALFLNNLAVSYVEQGQYVKAEPLYIEALKVREKAFGKEHPSYANSLNNLAVLYVKLGQYNQAEQLHLEAVKVLAKALGKGHPSYAICLNTLALLYYNQGQYAKAEPLYVEANEVFAKTVGKDHSYYATSLNSLAALYHVQGQYAKSEPLYLEALSIKEKSLGKDHPTYALNLNSLASLYYDQGEYAKAEPLLLASYQTYFTVIRRQMLHLSEKERKQLLATFSHHFERFHSFVLRRVDTNPAITKSQFNNLLVTKALLFNQLNTVRNAILGSGSPSLVSLYNGWLDKRNRLAKAYSLSEADRKKRGIDVETLEAEANEIEKQLSLQSSAFASVQKVYSFDDIKAKLKPSQAAIEMVRFRYYDKMRADSVLYGALIVTARSSSPHLVVLPEGKKMEAAWIGYYKNRMKFKMEDTVSYGHYWKSIAEHPAMKGVKEIFLAPDGVYNTINPQTLFDPQSSAYLGDGIQLHVLSSTRSLVAPKNKPVSKKEAQLFGFPTYGLSQVNKDNEISEDVKRFFEGGVISSLPGTERELDRVTQLLNRSGWKSQVFKAEEATEESLKALTAPSVIHIATHGFFFDDFSQQRVNDGSQMLLGMEVQTLRENPLLRSGLLLAGAQFALDGKPNAGKEDGILTAYEAQNLNLNGTELVVLSACETGLGEINSGEGVYGLQRAFQTAGARSVLMTLWKVDDEATEKLMYGFYRHWLAGMVMQEAFKKAQLELRKVYAHPYFWGSFVLMQE